MTTPLNPDGTIHVEGNQPVSMPRPPQLGDTRVHFGGEPFVRSDTTESEEKRPKGLDLDGSGFEDGGLGQILGGHASAQSASPEKNILQTGENNQFSNSDGVTEFPPTPESLAWTNGEATAWMIRNEETQELAHFDSYAHANEYFDAVPRTRWLIPGADEVVGWKAAHPASVASDINPVAGSGADVPSDTRPPEVITTFGETTAVMPNSGGVMVHADGQVASTQAPDVLAIYDGTNAVGTGPLV